MRTTLDIDAELLTEVTKLTGEKSRSKAVCKALAEYIREVRLQALRQAPGRITIDDNWQKLEEMELDEQRGT